MYIYFNFIKQIIFTTNIKNRTMLLETIENVLIPRWVQEILPWKKKN